MAVPAHGLYGIDSCRSSSDTARRCCDDNLVQNFQRERARARRERGQKGSIPSRKSIDPGLCANSGVRAVAEAVIVSHGNPIVALTKWSRVAGSVGVFQRPRRSRCIEREHPNAHSRARLEKLCALPRRPGSWGSSPRSRTSAPSTVTRACATMAQRHRPQIFAERTANVDE